MIEHDPTDEAGNAKAKKDKATQQKLDQHTESADIGWLMTSKRGRRIVWRLLDQAGVFRTSFNTNSMTMAFNEGARNGGLRLIEMIHIACPELYVVMQNEAAK